MKLIGHRMQGGIIFVMSKTRRGLTPKVCRTQGPSFCSAILSIAFVSVSVRWPLQLQIVYLHTTASKPRKAAVPCASLGIAEKYLFARRLPSAQDWVAHPERVAGKAISGHLQLP